jgi:hypothetical protein
MARAAIIFLGVFFSVVFLSAETSISESSDHALISSENHGILAPGSSEEFRFPRPEQKTEPRPQAGRIPKKAGTPPAAASASASDTVMPASLYSLREAPWGWTLSIKAHGEFSSAVLISPAQTTAQGKTVYALRSPQTIGNTNKAEIFWGSTVVGAKEDLHFLASSAFIDDPEGGRVLRIEIPAKAIYGYAQEGIREYLCEKEGAVRVRLYGLAYAHPMSKSVTYRIPLAARTL